MPDYFYEDPVAASLRAYGVNLPYGSQVLPWSEIEAKVAYDSIPGMITTANGGVPSFLTTYFSNENITVAFAPLKAEQIFGVKQLGSVTDKVLTFRVLDQVGSVEQYHDHNNGAANIDINANFPRRQPYLYQVMSKWGHLEVEMTALARISLVEEKNRVSIDTLNRFQNYSYFYGINGLENYGALNSPNLLPPITPGPKSYNSGASGPWITNGAITATGQEVYNDFLAMWAQMQLQTAGLVEATDEIVVAMSPQTSVALGALNVLGNRTAMEMIKDQFPKLRIETAPQYQNDTGGNLIQMFVPKINGEDVAYCSYNVKLHVFPVVVESSSFTQKKMQGTNGFILQKPIGIVQMLGV